MAPMQIHKVMAMTCLHQMNDLYGPFLNGSDCYSTHHVLPEARGEASRLGEEVMDSNKLALADRVKKVKLCCLRPAFYLVGC